MKKLKIELDDEVKQELRIARISAKVSAAMFVFIICILFMAIITGAIFVGPLRPIKAQVKSNTEGLFGSMLGGWMLDDDLSDAIIQICTENNATDYEKLTCVHDFMAGNYKYNEHRLLLKKFGDLMKNGGVCRDFANNFCRIMNRMKLDCYLVHTTDHVFSVVEYKEISSLNEFYGETEPSIKQCVVDQITKYCW